MQNKNNTGDESEEYHGPDQKFVD